jgi:hypothetical protein
MRTLVLNESNIVGDGNNTLEYKFPTSVDLTGSMIAVGSVNMYYSWFNISSELGNNKIAYTWIQREDDPNPASDDIQEFIITIPDGLYEIADLNSLLQFEMIKNGHYLIIGDAPVGDVNAQFVDTNVYYIEMRVNKTRYAVEIITYSFPTELPAGWSTPDNFSRFPLETFNPEVKMSNPTGRLTVGGVNETTAWTSKINELLGFDIDFETNWNRDETDSLSYLSSKAPRVQPNSNVIITVSNIDNKYANPTSVIYSFAPRVGFAEMIIEAPNEFNWNIFTNGFQNQLRVQLLGTNLRPLQIRDPQMTIILLIKDPEEILPTNTILDRNGKEITGRGFYR